jgi:hypothetical protein
MATPLIPIRRSRSVAGGADAGGVAVAGAGGVGEVEVLRAGGDGVAGVDAEAAAAGGLVQGAVADGEVVPVGRGADLFCRFWEDRADNEPATWEVTLMRECVRHRLTFANVCSALALFVAFAGRTAYAANTIGSSDVIDESLRSEDIKNGEVKTSDLANNAVDTNKILDGGVKAADLGANSVVTTKIGPGEVKNSDLGDNSITSDKSRKVL